MDFLDVIDSWVKVHTFFSKGFTLGSFMMFLLICILGFFYIIKSFNYPLFPRRGTFFDAMDVIAIDKDNHSGHKSMILDFCLGLYFLGLMFTDFIIYSLAFMVIGIGITILRAFVRFLKWIF